MSTEKSERILAALSRAKASRPPTAPQAIEPVEVAEAPLTLAERQRGRKRSGRPGGRERFRRGATGRLR